MPSGGGKVGITAVSPKARGGVLNGRVPKMKTVRMAGRGRHVPSGVIPWGPRTPTPELSHTVAVRWSFAMMQPPPPSPGRLAPRRP